MFATSASTPPQNGEDGVKTYSYTDKNGNSSTVAGENVKHPERLSAADFDENHAFLTKEDAAKAEAESIKPRVRTEEELKQSGAVKDGSAMDT